MKELYIFIENNKIYKVEYDENSIVFKDPITDHILSIGEIRILKWVLECNTFNYFSLVNNKILGLY